MGSGLGTDYDWIETHPRTPHSVALGTKHLGGAVRNRRAVVGREGWATKERAGSCGSQRVSGNLQAVAGLCALQQSVPGPGARFCHLDLDGAQGTASLAGN